MSSFLRGRGTALCSHCDPRWATVGHFLSVALLAALPPTIAAGRGLGSAPAYPVATSFALLAEAYLSLRVSVCAPARP
jgi:hypothetical protein